MGDTAIRGDRMIVNVLLYVVIDIDETKGTLL